MNNLKYLLCVGFFLLFLYSCGEPSMEDDALKAAQYTNESNKFAMKNDITNAGRTYSQCQVILNKYKRLGKFDEFYKLYNGFLESEIYEEFGDPIKAE